MQTDDPLATLVARAAIQDTLSRYTRAVDRVDVDAMKSCFHADATLYQGGFQMGAVDFCSAVEGMLLELVLTHHQTGNMQYEIHGETAYVETYFTAIHRIGSEGWSPFPQALPGDDLMIRGRYLDQFERREGVWAIARREATTDWVRFDRADDRGLVEFPPEPVSSRDKKDPAYRR